MGGLEVEVVAGLGADRAGHPARRTAELEGLVVDLAGAVGLEGAEAVRGWAEAAGAGTVAAGAVGAAEVVGMAVVGLEADLEAGLEVGLAADLGEAAAAAGVSKLANQTRSLQTGHAPKGGRVGGESSAIRLTDLRKPRAWQQPLLLALSQYQAI